MPSSSASALLPLMRELNDLKRIRVADQLGSLTTRCFRRAWARLVAGEDVEWVALSETAHIVGAARLAGVDARVLHDGGLDDARVQAVLQSGFDAVATPILIDVRTALRNAITAAPVENVGADTQPPFVGLLMAQPRAGATRPDHPRVVLEPTENHADHCAMVAVYAVLFAPIYEADLAQAFLAGLAHHLHNAYLPDAGYAGDELLGDDLAAMHQVFRQRAIGQLPTALRQPIEQAIATTQHADTPAAQAFQAADVLDRVLEMAWHAQSAAFTLDVALGEMDIVHPGNVQSFHLALLRDVGLM